MAARKAGQTRELVRLSPMQFSLSVSIVVILMGGAGLAGYYYGMRHPERTRNGGEASVSGENVLQDQTKPSGDVTTEKEVTFYTALTEPRNEPPPRKSAETSRVPSGAASPVKPSVPEPARTGPGSGMVMLQVASYKDRISAGKLLQELSSDGYAGTVARVDLGERGIWYRVRIGPFGSEKDGKKVLDDLRRERSLKGYVVK